MTAEVGVFNSNYRENMIGNHSSPTNGEFSEKGSLNETVKSVVDGIVQDAVVTASLREEKRRVQGLINNLVSKVRDEAVKDTTSNGPVASENSVASEKPVEPATAKPATPIPGVPFGDHRLRRVGSLPVAWMQTMDSVTLNIDVPDWVRKQNVVIAFTPGSVKVTVSRDRQSPPVVNIDEPLVAKIDTDGCTWALEGAGAGRQLTLELEKGREQWWARLFMSDDPKLYTVVDSTGRSRAPINAEKLAASDHTRAVPSDKQPAEGDMTDEPVTVDATSQTQEKSVKSSTNTGMHQRNVHHQSLEETVAGVVKGVVDSVSKSGTRGGHGGAANRTNGKAIAQRSSGEREPPKRILTAGDLRKMVEQYREEMRKAGPGAAEAAIQLGTFYHFGVGVEKNDAEAARMYRYGLENGAVDSSAAFQLGIICNQGAEGMEANPTEAVQWWKVSASLGNSVAMFNLGVMAMNGSGCDMDPLAALRWWHQATALNPQLQAPPFSKAQIEERIATAKKLKKQRAREAMAPEERKRVREEALRKARMVGYTSAGILGLGLSVVAIRYWWRNRL